MQCRCSRASSSGCLFAADLLQTVRRIGDVLPLLLVRTWSVTQGRTMQEDLWLIPRPRLSELLQAGDIRFFGRANNLDSVSRRAACPACIMAAA